jgi:hypothetical protein
LHSLLRPLRNLRFTVSSIAIVFFACRSSSYVYGRHRRLAISLVHLAFDIGRNHSLLVIRMRAAFDQQSQIISPLVPPMKTFKHTHYLSLAFPTIIHFAILRNHGRLTKVFRIAFTKFSTLNDVFSIVIDRLRVSNGKGVPCRIRCLSEMRRNLSIPSVYGQRKSRADLQCPYGFYQTQLMRVN